MRGPPTSSRVSMDHGELYVKGFCWCLTSLKSLEGPEPMRVSSRSSDALMTSEGPIERWALGSQCGVDIAPPPDPGL